MMNTSKSSSDLLLPPSSRVNAVNVVPQLHTWRCLLSPRNTATRAKVVEEWARDGGVLLMGYEMYRLLSLKKNYVAGRKKKNKKATGPVVINVDEEDRQQELLKGSREEGGRKKDVKHRRMSLKSSVPQA